MTETADITQLTAYTQPSVIKQAAEVFLKAGCTVNEAVTAFINRVAETKEMPFEYEGLVPNAETLEAMQEADDMINGRIPKPPYQSVRNLIEEMKANGEI